MNLALKRFKRRQIEKSCSPTKHRDISLPKPSQKCHAVELCKRAAGIGDDGTNVLGVRLNKKTSGNLFGANFKTCDVFHNRSCVSICALKSYRPHAVQKLNQRVCAPRHRIWLVKILNSKH